MSSLVLDVGNTRLKWGVCNDGELIDTGQLLISALLEDGLNSLTSKLPIEAEAILVSNVAGATMGTRLRGVLGAHCQCEVQFVSSEASACGVVSGYSEPRQLGVDRWVAMIGAWAELGRSCLVVDAGTAVTIDALGDDGLHLGGQIFPGFRLMTGSLASGTSDLPGIPADAIASPYGSGMFADQTSAAIIEGSWNAIIGAVERARQVLCDAGADPAVVLTGGDASRILDVLADETIFRPDLVLQGLVHILEYQR